jgi:transposase
VQVRRFFCPTTDCPQRTFAERLPEVAATWARSTARLEQAHRLIGRALGGEAGARLAAPLGLSTSPDTLLRRVQGAALAQVAAVRVLGVDDWAWRRGHRYGTILCDLERHRPVDLLPERSADTLSSWLKEHPEIEIISRDRGDEYIKGATDGAPQAVQVADRWHLLVNLREALLRALDRHHALVLEAAKVVAARQESKRPAVETPEVEPAVERPSRSRAAEQGQQRRARRLERYERVLERDEQGVSLRGIARRMRMHRDTVRRWLRAGSFPEQAQRRVTSSTDPFIDYLRRRWDEGCHNAARLTEEIRALGFRGSSLMVRRRVARWRQSGPTREGTSRQEPTLNRPSSRRVSWWLLKERADLKPEEDALLQALWDRCPELKVATELAREFADMVRRRRSGEWDSWMAKVQAPGVARELHGFAEGLRQDEAAVKAALSLEWSNGQVEGQINRLKTLKRQMSVGQVSSCSAAGSSRPHKGGDRSERVPVAGVRARSARWGQTRAARSAGDPPHRRVARVGVLFDVSTYTNHQECGRARKLDHSGC